ncbi:DNA glycosylase AlkZ-like family protein [Actinokineospora spheciospongiae]|uniref:DNA glycosylase AlkZ-like family protein n=1 Tax=Actinokineospora spheciospongiae TaxID=909613 RepID=UPI00054FF743|nr:crosslink repair DNA glycosylase YcaQ family protein [Actinokineospora spheciospongiae]
MAVSGAVVSVSRARVLAHRVARHGLHRDGVDAVVDLGVQDGGSGGPAVALAARGLAVPDPVAVWTLRGAPHVLRREDVAATAEALWPRSDADALARLGGFGSALRKAGVGGLEAIDRASRVMREVVAEEKPRGQVSAEMTAALPAQYSYACATCAATHVWGSLFQLVGVFAGVEVLGAARPTRLRPLPHRHDVPTAASGTLLDAYLRVHGPSTLAAAAAFLGTTQAAARPAWPAHLVPVDVEGTRMWLPEADVEALRGAPDADVVRLLPPLDPLVQARDRETLVPDPAERARVWKVIGNPGTVLAGGAIVGTWRAKASGRKLAITVAGFAPLPGSVRRAVAVEAEVVAGARGVAEVRVEHT